MNAKGASTALVSGIGANMWVGLLIIATFGAGAVVPGLFSDYAEQVGFRLMLYIALAESWNLLAGYCGLVSLGSASFIGLGAYVFVGMINGFVAPISGAMGSSHRLRATAKNRKAEPLS